MVDRTQPTLLSWTLTHYRLHTQSGIGKGSMYTTGLGISSFPLPLFTPEKNIYRSTSNTPHLIVEYFEVIVSSIILIDRSATNGVRSRHCLGTT